MWPCLDQVGLGQRLSERSGRFGLMQGVTFREDFSGKTMPILSGGIDRGLCVGLRGWWEGAGLSEPEEQKS